MNNEGWQWPWEEPEEEAHPGMLLSRWTFEVRYEEDGSVVTYTHVERPMVADVYHATEGPLYSALIEAYEEVGLVCPLVVDDGLLRLAQSEDGAEP